MTTARITRVLLHTQSVELPLADHVYSGAGLKASRECAFLELETDDGLSGIGPIGSGSARALGGIRSLVEELFAPSLIGRDAGSIEASWSELYYEIVLRQLGPRGLGVAILSGIDIALWDLAGKRVDRPIHELLGGPVAEKIPVYASGIYDPDRDAAVAQALALVADGFDAMKVKVGFLPHKEECERLEAIRAAVGPGVELMADANMGLTRFTALYVGQVLAELGFVFFEEPLPIDDVEGHAWLQSRLDLRLATGENLYTRWAFPPFLEGGAVGVVQPEASKVGGISESRRVMALASASHVAVAPHSLGNALTLATAAQLCAADSSCAVLEYEVLANPLTTLMVRGLPERHGPYLDVPTGPGLGIELDRDWMSDHEHRGGGAQMSGSRPRVGIAGAFL